MLQSIKNTLVREIHKHTSLPVPDLDTEGKRPEYPFLTLKITSPYLDKDQMYDVRTEVVKSLDDRFKHDILETRHVEPHAVVSVNSYGASLSDAYRAIKGAYEWIRHVGYYEMQRVNAVIVEVQDIQDRTLVLEDVYVEYRYGFDFRFRYKDEIERRVETIDKAKVQKGEDW